MDNPFTLHLRAGTKKLLDAVMAKALVYVKGIRNDHDTFAAKYTLKAASDGTPPQ